MLNAKLLRSQMLCVMYHITHIVENVSFHLSYIKQLNFKTGTLAWYH